MGIFIGILTGILVILCILLVLIILMQKSKQDTGLGAAFGGAATEQLFGAGTTSVLTKATIWGTALFFVITLILAMYYSHEHKKSGKSRIGAPPALSDSGATNVVDQTTGAADTNALPASPDATDADEPAVASETNAPATLTDTNSPATK